MTRDEQIARIDALHARDAADLDNGTERCPDARLCDYAEMALDRMAARAWQHMTRYSARALPDGDGICALLWLTLMVSRLARAVAAGKGGILMSSGFYAIQGEAYGFSVERATADEKPYIKLVAAVASGLRSVREGAEADWAAADHARLTPKQSAETAEAHQSREIETSFLRPLWSCFLGVEEDRHLLREGVYSPERALWQAADRLARAPGLPDEAI